MLVQVSVSLEVEISASSISVDCTPLLKRNVIIWP